jgi:glycosyltransferase 2 family protein
LKDVLKYGVSLALAGGLLYYTLKDYSFDQAFALAKTIQWSWLLFTYLLLVFSYIFRAIRWNMLLKATNYQPSVLNTTLAIALGYLANYVVPRMGEVTRCATLKNTDQVPLDTSIGTVITERIIDTLCLLLLLLLNLVLEYERLSTFIFSFFKEKLEGKTNLLIGLGFASILLLSVLFVFRKKILAINFVQSILQKVSGFGQGLTSVIYVKSKFQFLTYTILIWGCYFLMTYCMIIALPATAHLGLLAAFTVLIIGSFGVAAPTPGGIGAYHILVSSIVLLYGLQAELGKTLAILLHTTTMFGVLVFGILALLILFVKKNNIPLTHGTN